MYIYKCDGVFLIKIKFLYYIENEKISKDVLTDVVTFNDSIYTIVSVVMPK